MLGGTVGAGSPSGDELLTVTVLKDEHGYGMKVSGDNPVYVQSVKEHGAAWRAGLRAGDRILRVDSIPVHHHTHQQVVQMIRANPSTLLTVQQNTSRHKTPITAPVPVNSEKQRQLEVSKAQTFRLMLEQEQKFIRDLRNELLKVPDVRKQTQLESAEQRCSTLQHEIDTIMASQPDVVQPTTPRLTRSKDTSDKSNPPTGFLSGLPRSLSNLTGQSLRNLRQARQKMQQENQPPLIRQNSDDRRLNNTVPMIPTTCLDNSPPPLPPRSIERPKRNPLSPTFTVNPLSKPKPSVSQAQNQFYKGRQFPFNQSVYREEFRKSSHSLDGEIDGPQPNSISMQMSYPLVNVPPPPLQTDNRNNVPVMHVRSQSSPEHLDHELARSSGMIEKETWTRGTPPPGTPPPPYPNNNPQPCSDPQRAIISMEEDESPSSDNSTYSGLFSNLRTVRESKARMAVLINWLLGERRCACASLFLVLTDAYRAAGPVGTATLRRWAYEIHSVFLMPDAVLQLNGVDENMANEIEHVLENEYEKEELLRNVFRKARRQAKDELARQLSEFQGKRRLGLGTLYGPDDVTLQRCIVDNTQEVVVVERIMCQRLSSVARGGVGCGGGGAVTSPEAHSALLAALVAAALCLNCRPASVAAAVGGSRSSFLQRDKLYKQRLKQLTKQHPQPFVVRGHHLQLQALTSVAHCHHCDHAIWGLAPQAYVCTDCALRVHRACARNVEEGCCLDGEHHNNRISRFMERIHHNNNTQAGQDSSDRKSRKSLSTANFLNMERSVRKMEDESPWDQTLTSPVQERRDESDESLYESADCQSDVISASDDALPRLGKTPTISKESLKLAITDEESELRSKKGHRKTMSLSNPLEIVKTLGDEWFDYKKDNDKNSDKKKSRESLWSEEDKDTTHGSNINLDQSRKNSKKDKSDSKSNAAKRKSASVGALNFLRRKKTPTSMKPVEAAVIESDGTVAFTDEMLNLTRVFLEEEKRFAAICNARPILDSDSDYDIPTPKIIGEHRRRLSRQTSRSKSKVRGKSKSVKMNTLRKSHSGTLKKAKKKSMKVPTSRSRQASIVEPGPIVVKKNSENNKQNSWLFSASKGESRREGSTDEPAAADVDNEVTETSKDQPEKEHSNWRGASVASRGVNRAESCRERDAPRRGKHRNASDPNRLTAHHNHDLEPGAATAPSGSSSSSSLSSRSNESNTVAAEQQDWSEEEEPLAAQWSDSLPPNVRDTIVLCARLRKRQEVIHELILSEGSHVRWLKVLGGDFLKPLEKQPSLLPVEELRALFPNLPSVRERHSRLYTELRAVRNEAPNHIVQIRPVADALLNTLGETGYASCLSRFCRGQRMALEVLRERRKKNKELQTFLAGREQLPRCGRLQLRDLLACVWQRLTKYQLLLESILKTVSEEVEGDSSDRESEEDIAQLRRALTTAKEVLHSVDTAIRTAENEHRLKTIQSKLEVRVPSGVEWEELRRLDLTAHELRTDGELHLRTDNKKMAVLALMLEDSLVLLQRENDRFLLKPISQPSQNGHLSPLIKWDKVLFRPNAAVRNTFFLMNINGIQMHELSATTPAEYAKWVRLIQESPLARLAEAKSLITSHHHTRSADDSGINVSRNPSDASTKSASSAPPDDTCDSDRDIPEHNPQDKPESVDSSEQDRASTDREDRDKASVDKEEVKDNRAVVDKDDVNRCTVTVGRITTHVGSPDNEPCLVDAGASLRIVGPVSDLHTAHTVLSHTEQLSRLDEAISRALLAKSAVVAEALGVPIDSFTHLSELAAADVVGELRTNEDFVQTEPDIHQVLLAAQAQVNQLTEALSNALTVSEAGAISARAARAARRDVRRELCTTCHDTQAEADQSVYEEIPQSHLGETMSDDRLEQSVRSIDLSHDLSHDLSRSCEPIEPVLYDEWGDSAVSLARRLVPVSAGLQSALGRLIAELPALHTERDTLRATLAAYRDRHDKLMTEEKSFPGKMVDQSIEDQPSNGG